MSKQLAEPELVEVTTGVYAYLQPDGGWMLNNTGIVSGQDGSYLLIDTTSTEARNRRLLAAVATISPEPPTALINTHHHGDHTFGNWLMPKQTPIIGHVTCREDVLAAGVLVTHVLPGPDYGHIEVRPPNLTFTDTMTLHVGERRVELIHVGPAHTRSDVLVWLPEERVLFSGDIVFAGGQPFLVEGSIEGYPKGIAAIRALQPEILVPGHGPVIGNDDIPVLLDDLVEYTAFVADTARQTHAAGLSPLEAATKVRDNPYAEWPENERLVGNLYRAYSELDGNPPAARIPLDAVVADMIAFNGGPIGCFA